MSAGDAGDGEEAEGGIPAEHGEEAELAGTVERMAQRCDESGINYCFGLKTQQI